MVNPFEAATRLLNRRESQKLSIRQRLNLFFIDFELMPLLIQENYLTAYGIGMGARDMEEAAESADYISLGDCVSTTMRTGNDWNLLPDVGLCSSVAPAMISARMPIFAKFPQ